MKIHFVDDYEVTQCVQKQTVNLQRKTRPEKRKSDYIVLQFAISERISTFGDFGSLNFQR